MKRIDWRHWFKKKKEKDHGYDFHKTKLGKVWHFLAHDESWMSFIVDAILVLVLGKFVILPLIGFALGTSFPLVAVVSSSMDHDNMKFNEWWSENGKWYEEHNISREQFAQFSYVNGFNKGDVFVVRGLSLEDVQVGDVIVYTVPGKSDPIIHRVVRIKENVLITKGDANPGQLDFELEIRRPQLKGKAIVRVPYIGWVKVIFIEAVNVFR